MKKVILTNEKNPASFTLTGIHHDDLNTMLREKFLLGIVHFSFQKKDGSVREAFGTLQPEKIAGFETVANESQNKTGNPTLGIYFDIDANAWRSYTIANLIAVY